MKKNTKNWNETTPPHKNNNTTNIVGTVIVLLGLALLFKTMNWGNFFPGWLFGWEMILIVIGLVIGVNSRFEKKSSVILIAVGSIFLIKDMLNLPVGKFIIPAAIILLGIYLIKRNRALPYTPPMPPQDDQDDKDDTFDWDKRVDEDFTFSQKSTTEGTSASSQEEAQPKFSNAYNKKQGQYSFQYDNHIQLNTIFADTKKVILTKNFLGGTVTNIFGSSQINLLQADINQPVVLDIFQLFGSTKIIIPTNWIASANVSSIIGDLDDRRIPFEITMENNKKLYITGTSIFGSVTIRNS
ncbi:LiaF transmembrane domain-containing protein [Sphingobacterium hungaricum]|uniref:LiaF transmembrane domain-containing protein n=1 Tax=Sphingobacterium hungaricum TaxID=2082723 RepID=A0A928YRH5_9SPHI|nr:LiaF domain-containing protein [Sphingobacterium hungaricum]MBE8714657.1 hypothetical protein [Sphingobacterium hungaricum]